MNARRERGREGKNFLQSRKKAFDQGGGYPPGHAARWLGLGVGTSGGLTGLAVLSGPKKP